MDKNQCFELGYIERSHGLDGSVLAVFDADDSTRYLKSEAIFVERKNQLVPFLIKRISHAKGDRFIIHFEGINNDSAAQELKGSGLFLPETALPKLKADQYYYHELVGAQVVDHSLGQLGTIAEVYEFPHQTLLGMAWNDAEVLIPVHNDIVKRFDRAQNQLHTNLPEGLVEVYLQPAEDQSHEN